MACVVSTDIVRLRGGTYNSRVLAVSVHEVADAVTRKLLDSIIELLLCVSYLPLYASSRATDPGFARECDGHDSDVDLGQSKSAKTI